MTTTIIELQIPRWSTGCAASHTKSARFKSMAVDNNREDRRNRDTQDDSNAPLSRHSRGTKTLAVRACNAAQQDAPDMYSYSW